MNDDYNTEYRYVLTNKDSERIERLIMLLGDAIYELFKQRELTGNLAIDETPSLQEMKFHESAFELTHHNDAL